jgi:CO/xanthine dehydrogenase FAD-binding subunit
VDVFIPHTLDEALEVKSEHPDVVPIAGGTDLMVELNFDMRRPEAIMDLTRIHALSDHSREDGKMRVGAGVTYSTVIGALAIELPGLAIASRTVGSPQIRNRGTIGGNVATSSPAGDALPVLYACGAELEVASVRGSRTMPVIDFIVGPKRNVLERDELITAVLIPCATGPQQFSKIGTRNAMVIAVASFAVVVDPPAQRVGTGIGSAGPTPIPATEAEVFISEHLNEIGGWEQRRAIDEAAASRFGELVAAAAAPITDVRGTADYRRHALSVMARRTLGWAWNHYVESSS